MSNIVEKTPEQIAEEKEFRKERSWHSFLGVLYSGLSAATFTGVIIKLVDLAVKSVAQEVSAWDMIANPVVGLTLAGFMAAGVVSTHFAQQEWTEVKMLEDEHLAKKNALCLSQQHAVEHAAPEHAHHHEHAPQHRRDGKTWQETVAGKNVMHENFSRSVH